MKPSPHRLALAVLLAFSVIPATYAARPMVTDDARIVDPKSCQVESWAKLNRDSQQFWAIPACNPTGNLELSFGGARTREDGGAAFTDEVVQAKTMLRPLKDDWGLALTVGTDRHPHREVRNDWPGDPYVNVPFSVKAAGDDWLVHLNAGAVRHRDEGRTIGTWGLGNEIRLRETLYFIPEIFSTDRARPFWQAGLRYWIVKDRIQMDGTVGDRVGSGGSGRWASIGLRLLSPPFLR